MASVMVSNLHSRFLSDSIGTLWVDRYLILIGEHCLIFASQTVVILKGKTFLDCPHSKRRNFIQSVIDVCCIVVFSKVNPMIYHQ